MKKRMSTGLLQSTAELRKLIIENPNLPLLVFAGDEANIGDYSYISCSYVKAYIGKYLDCMQEVDDCKCYTDKDEFEEDLADTLYDDFQGTDEEWDEYLSKEVAKYDPYWTECIILYVNN